MAQLAWWPVVLILLLAPFATYGYGWLERQTMLAVHNRQLDAYRTAADKQIKAAYADGRRDGTAEVRASELVEAEKTREVIREVEKVIEVPPPTPAEVLALCRRSSSCRERGALK
jgi:hypothetical protein